MEILQVKEIKKTYTTRFGGNQVQALKGVSFSVQEGEYVAIMGESGSGKTTLLNILAALDKPTGGQVMLAGKRLDAIEEKELAAFRRDNLGFVFQEFNLLDTFSIEDNILLPLVLAGRSVAEMKSAMEPLVRSLGIDNILKKFPYEVSGGQKQRAAGADHSHGDPFRGRGLPRRAGSVHSGRGGVPPDLSGGEHQPAALQENFRHPDHAPHREGR